MLVRRVETIPHGLKRIVITDKSKSKTNNLGNSAGTMMQTSRIP
ncbi:hypothetical protein ACQKIW_30980 [Bacillus thuringiensis]